MSDLTPGTQLASNSSGFGNADLESGKFSVSSVGVVSVRTVNTGSFTNTLATITVATGKSAGTLTSLIGGNVTYITQTTPDLTGTGTATTRLVDSSGGTIVQLAAQAESVVKAYGTTVPINTSMSWISDTSGTGQASPMNIILNVHYEQ